MSSRSVMENITKIKVPKKMVQKSNGFAIDIGGSVVKIVYLSKEEMAKGGQDDQVSETISLHMALCSKDDVEGAIQFIKDNVYIRPSENKEPPVIFTTGVGSNQMTDRFNEEFGVRIRNIVEFDGFVKAIDFLTSNYPPEQVFTDFPMEGFCRGFEQMNVSAQSIQSWIAIDDPGFKMKLDPLKLEKLIAYCNETKEKLKTGQSVVENTPRRYPYLLGQFGSGFVYLKVHEDGSYQLLDLIPFAGRTFIDLGMLLTGSKTYEELITLAEAGNEDKLNVRMCDSVQDVPGDSYSTAMEDQTIIYSFGKLHGIPHDKVNNADVARTMLQTICANALKIAYHVMTRENCRDLYLCGSFVQSPLTQQIFAREFEKQRAELVELSTSEIHTCDLHLRTVRGAGMLGALGSFLVGCE